MTSTSARSKRVTTPARALSGICGLLLLGTAYLHYAGLEDLNATLVSAGISGFFAEALPVLWLFLSWHLVALSVPLIWAAVSNPTWFLPAVVFCTAVTVGDFLWVYSVAGWFPGTIILSAVAITLFCVSVALHRAGRGSEI